MSIYILTLVLELVKYWLGYKLFFQAQIKKQWVSIIGISVFSMIYWFAGLDNITAYLVMFLDVIILLYITVEEKLFPKTLHIIMLMCIILSLDEMLGIFVGKLYSHRAGIFTEEAVEFILSSLISLGIIIILQILSKKASHAYKENFRRIVRESIDIWVVIMAVSMLFAISGLLYVRSYIDDSSILFFVTIISILAYLSICVLVIFMVYIKHSNAKLESYIKIEKELKEMQQKYYENLLDKEEETRRFRHDMIHHFICLQELAIEEEGENVKNYIDKMQEQIVQIQNKSYHTGNDILDTLINYYASLYGKDILIHISGKCMSPIKIDDVGMCTIFSNLIQNAAESLESEKGSEKHLKIAIQQGEHYVQIQIANTVTIENDEYMGFESTKKDKKNHGFGLKNVIETVYKNEGRIDIRRKNGEFIAAVILKI